MVALIDRASVHPAIATTTAPIPTGEAEVLARARWPLVMAAIALAAYVATAIWMLYGLPYEIGDALARTADARYMLFSRDPHLAAVGFVWLPLPVLAQLPFMLVASPLHQAVAAGPISTAVGGALAVLVVAGITRVLQLGRGLGVALTAAYAFNPVIIFTSANGMSETWFYLFAAIALLGYVQWIRYGRTLDLVVISAGLAGAMFVRYETIAFIPLLALGAGVRAWRGPFRAPIDMQNIRRVASCSFVVALPGIWMLSLWLFAELLIMKSPFFWLHAQSSMGHTPAHAGWLPAQLTPRSIVGYSANLTLEIAPGLLLLAPLLLIRRRLDRAIVGMALLGCALLFPALIVYQLMKRVTWADPRYFEPLVLFTTVAAAWVAAELRPSHRSTRVLFNTGIIALLVLGMFTATSALSDPKATAIEQEHHFFRAVSGRPQVSQGNVNTFQLAPVIPSWKKLARELDLRTTNRDLILVDANVAFPAVVFTDHPDRYLISSDRDYERVVADPIGKVTYIVQVAGSPDAATYSAILAGTANGTWTKLEDFSVASVYRWVPGQAAAGSVPAPGVSPR